jgi:hypothetical protein
LDRGGRKALVENKRELDKPRDEETGELPVSIEKQTNR